MAREIPAKVWLRYQKLRDAGWSRNAACKEVGISYKSAMAFDAGEVRTSAAGAVIEAGKLVEELEADHVAPRTFGELEPVAQEALHDFDLFRRRYFGREPKPWQSEAARMVVELSASELREWVVLNVPPGAGKSTTFTHDIPVWDIARRRAFGEESRILLGSRTQRQANKYGRRVRSTLERPRPTDGAVAVLSKDYGEFKPLRQDLWRAEELVVWTSADAQPTDEKEPTLSCVGMDTGFLGGRYLLVIWDDLVDASTTRTEAARGRQQDWFDEEAETRLEPGGVFLLVGQRLAPDDLYRYALDKRTVDEEGVPQPHLPKYQHVIFKAHFEELCEDDHSKKAEAWPDGCLLDPKRLSWRDLQTVKANNPRRFEIIMQQQDVDPEGTLVPPVFIDGGEWNGIELPGCKDEGRSLCQLEDLSHDRLVSVITVDPSPTKFWAVQWWIYDQNTQFRWLMDLHRAAMDAPDFLDRLSDGRFIGIAQDWVQRAADLGWPIDYIVVEKNAAQRFLLQYDHVHQWTMQNGVAVVPHDTQGGNKADPEFGIQTLRSQYQYGRVRLPYGDVHTRSIVEQLITEVTTWPDGKTDDCVMAQWMLEWNIPNFESVGRSLPKRKVPTWV